jgi:flagellar FliL protein
MPQIRDAILLLTSSKTFGELQDLQGKMQLRAELIGHLNTLLAKGQVKHIYITNFVIQ